MSSIEIDFADEEVRQMLNAAISALSGDLTPIMKDIGEHMINETRDRFDRETGPDGKKWQALKASTLLKKRGNRILQEQGLRGGLLSSINARAEKSQVTIGTIKPYAAIHQFGGKTSAHIIKPKKAKALRWVGAGGAIFFAKSINHPGSLIPARPFLGVSNADTQEIIEIISDWMKRRGF